MTTKKIFIEGMGSDHCAKIVEKALKGICGVKAANVDLKDKSATVELAHDVDDEKFQAAIGSAGFAVKNIQ